MKQLHRKVAVVTGAASGIGRATSIALAKNGCDVAISDIDPVGVEQTVKEIEKLGRRVTSYVVDVADKQRMREFATKVIQDHGHVHILINNAGVAVGSSLEDHDLLDYEWIVGVNFWGVIYGCKFFIPYMKREHEGHIVNLSSVLGLVGLPNLSAYCATKFAVRGFSESLWHELNRFNIGVTSIHPGYVKTDIVKKARLYNCTFAEKPAEGPGGLREILQEMFNNMGCTPEDVARSIIKAIKYNKPRVMIHKETYLIDSAKRIMPMATNRVIQLLLDRIELKLNSPQTSHL